MKTEHKLNGKAVLHLFSVQNNIKSLLFSFKISRRFAKNSALNRKYLISDALERRAFFFVKYFKITFLIKRNM